MRSTRPAIEGIPQAVAALRDGRLDAFFASAGLPAAAILDAATSPGLRIRLLSDAHLADRLVADHGALYGEAEIPEGTYPGVPAVRVTTVRNLLVAREDMPADLAYAITRALFEKKDVGTDVVVTRRPGVLGLEWIERVQRVQPL